MTTTIYITGAKAHSSALPWVGSSQEALINFRPGQFNDLEVWAAKFPNVIKGINRKNLNGENIVEVELLN